MRNEKKIQIKASIQWRITQNYLQTNRPLLIQLVKNNLVYMHAIYVDWLEVKYCVLVIINTDKMLLNTHVWDIFTASDLFNLYSLNMIFPPASKSWLATTYINTCYLKSYWVLITPTAADDSW